MWLFLFDLPCLFFTTRKEIERYFQFSTNLTGFYYFRGKKWKIFMEWFVAHWENSIFFLIFNIKFKCWRLSQIYNNKRILNLILTLLKALYILGSFIYTPFKHILTLSYFILSTVNRCLTVCLNNLDSRRARIRRMDELIGSLPIFHWCLHFNRNGNNCYGCLIPWMWQCSNGTTYSNLRGE